MAAKTPPPPPKKKTQHSSCPGLFSPEPKLFGEETQKLTCGQPNNIPAAWDNWLYCTSWRCHSSRRLRSSSWATWESWGKCSELKCHFNGGKEGHDNFIYYSFHCTVFGKSKKCRQMLTVLGGARWVAPNRPSSTIGLKPKNANLLISLFFLSPTFLAGGAECFIQHLRSFFHCSHVFYGRQTVGPVLITFPFLGLFGLIFCLAAVVGTPENTGNPWAPGCQSTIENPVLFWRMSKWMFGISQLKGEWVLKMVGSLFKPPSLKKSENQMRKWPQLISSRVAKGTKIHTRINVSRSQSRTCKGSDLEMGLLMGHEIWRSPVGR